MFWPLSPCNRFLKNWEVLRIVWICSCCKYKWHQNGRVENKITTFVRWCEIFEFVRSECISLKKLVLEFSSAIPGTSVATENFLSQMLCGLSKRAVSLLKPLSSDSNKTHFDELSCSDFYTLISNNPKLLQEIRSSTKYKTYAQEDRTTRSTLTGN
jgi:hypothetical protein